MKPIEKLKLGGHLLMARATRRNRPLVVGWAVTNRCDAACAYCDKRQDTDPGELDTRTALALIDQLAAAGVQRLSISGGEPLLRDDLSRLIDHAVDRGIRCSLNTNGRLLPVRLPEIAQISALTLSVDAPQTTADQLRGPGSFQRSIKALEAARAYGIPVSLTAVLCKRSLDHVDELLELARAERCVVTFQPVDFLTSRRGRPHPQAPPVDRYRATIDRLIAARADGAPIGNTRHGLRHLRHWPGPWPITCAGGRITGNIESDGKVYPCGRVVDDVEGHDAVRMGFAEAWRRTRPVDCGRCWCARRVELNLAHALSPGILLELLRSRI